VGEGEALRGSGEAHAVVDAGVDGRIVDDDVAWLREAGEEADVGVEAGVAEETCWGVVEGGDLALEGLGVGAVAVEEAGAA